jgi:hypothetical protein
VVESEDADDFVQQSVRGNAVAFERENSVSALPKILVADSDSELLGSEVFGAALVGEVRAGTGEHASLLLAT